MAWYKHPTLKSQQASPHSPKAKELIEQGYTLSPPNPHSARKLQHFKYYRTLGDIVRARENLAAIQETCSSYITPTIRLNMLNAITSLHELESNLRKDQGQSI